MKRSFRSESSELRARSSLFASLSRTFSNLSLASRPFTALAIDLANVGLLLPLWGVPRKIMPVVQENTGARLEWCES